MTGFDPEQPQSLPQQAPDHDWQADQLPPVAATALVPVRETLPVPISDQTDLGKPKKKIFLRLLLVLALAGGAAAGGFVYWRSHLSPVPPGIAWSNGRIEADEIDISTKFAGRIAELFVDEGDLVTAGQTVARMDTRDLEASLRKASSQVLQFRQSLEEAQANVTSRETSVTLAKAEFERANTLLKRGFTTRENYDQRLQALDGANAALAAATARVGQAEHALHAAQNDVELYEVNIADNTLVAPRAGRIQYRIANVGEVLPAGGKVFTLLDAAYVYMNIYLPTADAGRTRVGSEARIVLDAYPNFAIPAHVSFVAEQAQFTPKTVETKSERDKLMFRVKVRVDADFLRRHAADVSSGLPGLAYVRLDPNVDWPARLKGPASDDQHRQ